MPAPSYQSVTSFGRSLSSGRVFARVEFKQDDIDSLVGDLNYAALPGTIERAGDVRSLGSKVLAYLKANYPQESATTAEGRVFSKRSPSKIVDGWRVKFYSAEVTRGGAASLVGFYLNHAQEDNSRTRTIIASLESGSRPYRIFPVEAKQLRFLGENNRPTYAKFADIPARKGFGFIKKTENYAESLLAPTGSIIEKEIGDIVEKSRRLNIVNSLNAEDVASAPASTVSAALDAIRAKSRTKSLFGRKSPLDSVKTLKRKLASRRFRKSFR